MSTLVSFELLDFSESKLLASKFSHNLNLFRLSKLLPYAPFLIHLFTDDSYWIHKIMDCKHLVVLNFLQNLPSHILKRKEFWISALSDKRVKIGKELDNLVISAIEKLKQLTKEERKQVKKLVQSTLDMIDQEEIVIDYPKLANENRELLADPEFVLKALDKENGLAWGQTETDETKLRLTLDDIDDSLLRDRNFMYRLNQVIPHTFHLACGELQQDREFISRAIEICPTALTYGFKINDRDLLLKAIECGLPLYHIGDIEPWKMDEEIVLKSVEMDDCIINDMDRKILQDQKFIMKAVLLNGMNYEYFKFQLLDQIENLDEFEKELVRKRASCINIVDPKFSTNEELVEKLVEINPFIMAYLSTSFSSIELMVLLNKAGQTMINQLKEIEMNNGKSDCKDWNNLLKALHSYPTPRVDHYNNLLHLLNFIKKQV